MKNLNLQKAEKMHERQFLCSLDRLGTFEELSDIVTYLSSGRLMTTERLSHLCYFAYAWGLVFFHRQIAPFSFMQTPYGPMEMTTRKMFPDHGIVPAICDPPELDHELKALLDFVLLTYGSMSIQTLETRLAAHMMDIPPGQTIGARDIFCFFSRAKDYVPERLEDITFN